jgi:DNA primase catalytic core
MNRTLEVADLKRTTRILDVLARYGIEAEQKGRQYMARCPFHDDGTPSLSVDPIKNVWHCFGCDAGGSVIDFVMKKDSLTFREAADRLLVDGGQVKRGSQIAAPTKSHGIDVTLIESVIEHYHKTLCGSDTRGLDYLKGRSLADPETLKTFKAGYVNGTLKNVLPQSAVEPLKQIGILNEKGNEFFYGCIVVPIFSADGTLGEIYGRSIEGGRHLYLPGQHRGILNPKAAEVFDEIILTEAVLDALSLYAIGVKNVIPCYGTNGFTEDHAATLKKTKRIFFAFDNDEAGENGAKKLADRLTADGIECHRVHIPNFDGQVKDLNDYTRHLRKQGMGAEEIKAAFADLVKQAPKIGYHREHKPGGLNLVEQTQDALVFQNCDALYHLRGLHENNGSALRVILTARHEDAAHTDRLDLYTAKHRVSFAYRAAHRLELPAAKIEEDLNRLIPMLEMLLTETKSKGEQTPRKVEIGEADRRDALALLRAPNLLDQIAEHLETVGYVGEERNKQLAYLIATSRKLSKPLSAIVRSESGAGKSYLMECVAELMPPEDVKYFSRLTPQSLYYMDRDELVHKLLVVDERDGSEEAEYPIRTLQTRRKLTLAVPIKDPSTGKIKTKMLEIFGPIAYMESSTQATINPENLNRCFELYLDDSAAQTARIMTQQRKARTLKGLAQDTRREAAVKVHQNAQRLLRPLKVVIPFAEALKFPAAWLRTRRDNERFLSLVEIVTFLHQHQRTVKTSPDGVEHVEATPDDYAIAYDLAKTVFAQTLQDVSKPAKDLFDQIKPMVEAETRRLNITAKDYWFTRRTIREHTKLPDYTIKRVIRELEELEYLDVKRSAQGGSFRYRLAATHTAPAIFDGLTTPQELARQVRPEVQP